MLRKQSNYEDLFGHSEAGGGAAWRGQAVQEQTEEDEGGVRNPPSKKTQYQKYSGQIILKEAQDWNTGKYYLEI